jgi:hypothetical protein
MRFFARPGLAIGFAAFFLCAETCQHAASIAALDWWDIPFHDWAVAIFLWYGAAKSRTDWFTGRPYQAVGWALNASLLFMALQGHLEELGAQPVEDAWISEPALIAIIALMLAIAVGGLWGTLRLATARKPN